MQALEIYEASLCPGCKRPIDVCMAATAAQDPVGADKHTCGYAVAVAVQSRIDAWENDTSDRRGPRPVDARPEDGVMYLPRPSTPEELVVEELDG